MHTNIIYCCDYCDFEDKDRKKVLSHEARHFNTSIDEYLLWRKLKVAAEEAGKRVSIRNNADTQREFDEACEELTNFELEHKIGEKKW